jgi:hypothetical protein
MKPAGKLVVVKLLNVVPIPARFGVILAQRSASTALSRQAWPAVFNEVVRRND